MDTSRFDWPAILRAAGIVIGITALYGFLIPVIGALAFDQWDTLLISGNEIYRFIYWGLAWGLIVWQGQWMLNVVHDRIIDDMLVVGAIVAIVLLVIKVVIGFVYWPTNSLGERLPLLMPIDLGAALISFVVALVAARVNRY